MATTPRGIGTKRPGSLKKITGSIVGQGQRGSGPVRVEGDVRQKIEPPGSGVVHKPYITVRQLFRQDEHHPHLSTDGIRDDFQTGESVNRVSGRFSLSVILTGSTGGQTRRESVFDKDAHGIAGCRVERETENGI